MAEKGRAQHCDREQALTRLAQAEACVSVAELVIGTEDTDVATPGVAASVAVLAGIAAADAACCARLKERARGQDHKQALLLVESVHPNGPAMAKDLRRLLDRKDDAHDGLTMIGHRDATKMVEWAKRLTAKARAAVEAG